MDYCVVYYSRAFNTAAIGFHRSLCGRVLWHTGDAAFCGAAHQADVQTIGAQ